jgi:hypothetical protein
MEIADTEALDFREALKQREVFLKRLLHTLSQEQVSRSTVPCSPLHTGRRHAGAGDAKGGT